MPRPQKCKKVCCLPESNMYGPLKESGVEKDIIIMTVEEYETVRLIDLEGLTQEECAEKMKVARATVQKIYNEARSKMAAALVNGNILKIQGGYYELYNESERMDDCGRCRRSRCSRDFLEEK